tara:strand:- start:2056 stop:2217 length:162 start_codon:yes stop_codon:yes gene_type:complete
MDEFSLITTCSLIIVLSPIKTFLSIIEYAPIETFLPILALLSIIAVGCKFEIL